MNGPYRSVVGMVFAAAILAAVASATPSDESVVLLDERIRFHTIPEAIGQRSEAWFLVAPGMANVSAEIRIVPREVCGFLQGMGPDRLPAVRFLPPDGGAPIDVGTVTDARCDPSYPIWTNHTSSLASTPGKWTVVAWGRGTVDAAIRVTAESRSESSPSREAADTSPVPMSAREASSWPGIIVLSSVGLLGFGRWMLAWLRIDRDGVLDHPRRQHLHSLIARRPGVTTADLVRATGWGKGVLRHHLETLLRFRLIRRTIQGRNVRFAAADSDVPAVLSDRQRALVRLVETHPGIVQKELARRLGWSTSLVSYHVRGLARDGLIAVRAEHRWRTCHPVVRRRNLERAVQRVFSRSRI